MHTTLQQIELVRISHFGSCTNILDYKGNVSQALQLRLLPLSLMVTVTYGDLGGRKLIVAAEVQTSSKIIKSHRASG